MALNKAVNILKRTREGREALLEIIETYGGFSNTTDNDPIAQARIVAKRQVAVDIIQSLLTCNMDSFTVMLGERYVRLNANRAKDEKDDD